MASESVDISLWGSEREKCFIDIMVDEVNKGNMKDGVFHRKIWDLICKELNMKTNKLFTVKQLREKYQRLRMKHRLFSQLLEQAGFGWNAESNIVTALDETWKNYTQVHPKASQFRKKGCEHYKLLGIIFNKPTVTGILHHASTQDPPNSDEENELYGFANLDDPNTPVDLETPSTQPTQSERSAKRSKINDKKKQKEIINSQLSEVFACFMEATKARTEASLVRAERYREKSVEGTSSVVSADYSLATCLKVLDEMENRVDDDTYMKALDKFTNNFELREAFIKMPLERKNAWLARID